MIRLLRGYHRNDQVYDSQSLKNGLFTKFDMIKMISKSNSNMETLFFGSLLSNPKQRKASKLCSSYFIFRYWVLLYLVKGSVKGIVTTSKGVDCSQLDQRRPLDRTVHCLTASYLNSLGIPRLVSTIRGECVTLLQVHQKQSNPPTPPTAEHI